MKQLFLFALLFPFVLLFTACGDDDETSGPPIGDETVAELVAETEGLSVLNTILSHNEFSELKTRLGSGEYTLLAPNDAAFQNLLSAIGISELGLLDPGVLSSILSYHIVPNQTLQIGRLDSSVVTLSQQTLRFTTTDSVRINAAVAAQPTASIVSPEALYASNGVVHVIDEVLLPPGLQEAVGDFGTVAGLMDVLRDVGLMDNVLEGGQLSSLLADETGNFTVISPVQNFLVSNNLNLSGQGLQLFGANHIIEGIIDVDNPPRKVNNSIGVPLYLSVAAENAIFVNGKPAINVGAEAENGQVLLLTPGSVLEFPQNLEGALGTIAGATGQSFSIFQAALSQTELTLTGEKTIFAPSDSAFIRAGLTASIDSTARIDNALLTRILNNHVVEGVAFLSDLQSGNITTVGDNQVSATITQTDNGTRATLSDNNAESPDASIFFVNEYVYFGNIPASEPLTEVGVIHAIDELLLPE